MSARRLARLVAVLVVSIPAASPAAEIVEAAARGRPVSELVIRGVSDELTDELRSGLALSGEQELLFFRDAATFYTETLREDLERTRLFMQRAGYPHVRVSPEVSLVDGGEKVRVVIDVEPGARVEIARVEVDGVPDSLAGEWSRDGLRAGEPFTDAAVEKARTRLQDLLESEGYAHAAVELAITRIDSMRVAVALRAEPGDVYAFGHKRIQGVSEGLGDVAAQVMGIEGGDVYSPKALERAEENLRLLGLFRRIEIETKERPGHRLDLIVHLSAREPRSIELGVGYWTDEEIQGSASWTHRNLFGRGRGFSALASYGTFQRRARLSGWVPTLWKSRTRGTLTLTGLQELEEGYELRQAEVELELTRRYTARVTFGGGIGASYVDVEVESSQPDALALPAGRLLRGFGRWEWNGTDNRLDPTSGARAWAYTDFAPPGLGSVTDYATLQTEGAVYVPWGPRVAAARLLVAAGRPFADDEALWVGRRFFAGGALSMRGYERRALGPKDGEGRPIGGEAKLESSVELRVPVVWRIGVAAFVDAAQVWETLDLVDVTDLELAVGPGVYVSTPVGPVRVDVGFRLGEARDEPARVWHLTIGHAF